MQKIAIVVLSLLLVLAVGYIGFGKYQERNRAIYQQGERAGYQKAVLQLYQHASACEQVPIIVEDRTLNVIAVDCLEGFVSLDTPSSPDAPPDS